MSTEPNSSGEHLKYTIKPFCLKQEMDDPVVKNKGEFDQAEGRLVLFVFILFIVHCKYALKVEG